MQKHTVAFSKDASNLFFHILTRCNLSCVHCYINQTQHGTRTLDLETILAWLRIFSDKAATTNLVFLGGEPTLHPDLSSAVTSARQMGFKSITIDTNGYLFHRILDRISPEDLDFISFSLDGATRAINDALRGKGCYDQVLTGIRAARARQIDCSLIYTVSDRNVHELPLMPDLLKELGIQRFFIQIIGLRGPSMGIDHPLQVSRDAWLGTIPDVAEQIARMGMVVTYPKVFLDPEEPFQCAGNVADNFFVFPNGRVYRCPLCEDFGLHSFEIQDNALKPMPRINETDLFCLDIPEGCVMNKLIQPGNLTYDGHGHPEYRIACCLLKQEISG